MNTTAIDHVTFVTADPDRALTFYEGLLGLRRLEARPYSPAGQAPGGGLTFGFDGHGHGAGGGRLVLEPGAGTRRGRWGVGGVHHVALGVGTEDGLLKWKRRLTDDGVAVTGPYDRGYFTSIYFTDPDGQILEIATAGPGYLIDESVEELGKELRMPPERILRGHRDEAAIAALTWPEPVAWPDEEMSLEGIHHISAITDDLKAAEVWYPDALGLELVKRTVNRDDAKTLHYFWAARDETGVAPHSALTLFGWPGSNYYARAGAGQTRRITYRGGSAEDLVAWREHLLSRGEKVSAVGAAGETALAGEPRMIEFQAPDGLLLALAADLED